MNIWIPVLKSGFKIGIMWCLCDGQQGIKGFLLFLVMLSKIQNNIDYQDGILY